MTKNNKRTQAMPGREIRSVYASTKIFPWPTDKMKITLHATTH